MESIYRWHRIGHARANKADNRFLKLGTAILSLVILLTATGYINLQFSEAAKTTIYRVFSQAPTIASQASGLASILPITSRAFLIGLAIGIWKG